MLLERGDIANSWRHERWDSLRLLTPNWQTRLPGLHYDGPNPDGYMTMGEVVEFIDRFAVLSRAPVRTQTAVTAVVRDGDGYQVTTNNGELRCRTLVIASGACNQPHVPAVHDAIPPSIGTSRRSTTATRRSCRKAACWSSGHQRPACSWPPRSIARAGP